MHNIRAFRGFFLFMAIKTYTEQLESVQAAIEAIESGKVSSMAIAGRSYTYNDLETLYAREERLMPKAQRESRGRKGARVNYVEFG